ncbi:Serine/Threonine protein kinase [Beggiatoa sp. PS]|nr:Serine/Threonine protein kinase [Beggiatoa sp. PS]
MQYKMADVVAPIFAENFYDKLSEGKSIDEAIFSARQAIYGRANLEELARTHWGIPVCYTRETPKIEKTEETEETPPKRLKSISFLAAFIILLFIGIILNVERGIECEKGKVFSHPFLTDGSGSGPQMVVIPSGQFRMGDIKGKGEDDEIPVHDVSIKKCFAIGIYEVTFEEYDHFARATDRELPSDEGWGRGTRPVINVSWNDAEAYTKWLTKQTGQPYRLPTEAQWEYAARAGKETNYWWSDDIDSNKANCQDSDSKWSNKQSAPVGSFEPNPFGLYDTVGNVWEWTLDPWHDSYDNAPSDERVWEEGKIKYRMLRGGSWDSGSISSCRSASRKGRSKTKHSNDGTGFRVAVSLEEKH